MAPMPNRCIASTGETFNTVITKIVSARHRFNTRPGETGESNSFHSAQWSADGSVIVTHNEDQCLRAFKVSNEPSQVEKVHQLEASHTLTSPANIAAFALHPDFDTENNANTYCLSSTVGEPLSLRNILPTTTETNATPIARYNWIDVDTEAHLRAFSLTFQGSSSFVAGGDRRIAVYDANHKYPVLDVKAPGRHAIRQEPLRRDAYNGKVSALAALDFQQFAAGTTDRYIMVCDNRWGVVQSISLVNPGDGEYHGAGVASLEWSKCQKYLVLAERWSNGLQVWDRRYLDKPLSYLIGRDADTSQRLGFSMISHDDDFYVCAGGLDGSVKRWKHAQRGDGYNLPDDTSVGLHSDAITSTLFDPSGKVMATCSGRRFPCDDAIEDFSSSDSESSSSEDDSKVKPEKVRVVSARRRGLPSIKDNSLKLWVAPEADGEMDVD